MKAAQKDINCVNAAWRGVMATVLLLLIAWRTVAAMPPEAATGTTLDCHRWLYTYRVAQSDIHGRTCWDSISVMSCWGWCDSSEISDWRFPYKRSYHPVCVHAGRTRALATLRHCEAGVTPGTERYEYLEATSCRCQACSSSDTSCEGLRYRGQRSQAMTILALGPEYKPVEDDYENLIE